MYNICIRKHRKKCIKNDKYYLDKTKIMYIEKTNYNWQGRTFAQFVKVTVKECLNTP